MRLGMGLHLTRLRGGVAEATALMANATLTRPSAAWAWGSDQLLDEYAADELRRDHDPATGAFRGVLVEESRTNDLLDNRNFSTGNWTNTGLSSITQDATGLDGVANTAWTLAGDSAERVEQTFSVPDDSNTHAGSVYFKKSQSPRAQLRLDLSGGSTTVTEMLRVDTSDGSVVTGTGTVEDAGDWWRVIVTITNNGTGNTSFICRIYPDRKGADGIETQQVVDFPQVELNKNIASLPIETDGTATTRAADVLEGAFSESSGTLHFVGEHDAVDGALWQADDGTEDSRMRLEVSGGDVRLVVDDGGVNQATLNAGALASDGTYSVAARFDASDFAISLDGAAAVTQASGTVPSVATQRFGRDTSATAGLNWYKTANYRSSKLTDSELETLTA